MNPDSLAQNLNAITMRHLYCGRGLEALSRALAAIIEDRVVHPTTWQTSHTPERNHGHGWVTRLILERGTYLELRYTGPKEGSLPILHLLRHQIRDLPAYDITDGVRIH